MRLIKIEVYRGIATVTEAPPDVQIIIDDLDCNERVAYVGDAVTGRYHIKEVTDE
jgi:hypothetical protein